LPKIIRTSINEEARVIAAPVYNVPFEPEEEEKEHVLTPEELEAIAEERRLAEEAEQAAREALMADAYNKRREAEELLAATKKDCELLKADNERECNARVEDAKKQAELILEEARQAGHQEGLEAGRLEGIEQIKAEQAGIIVEANAKAEQTIRDARAASRDYFIAAENDIANLVLEIANKILPQHFIDAPQVIMPLVRQAILKVRDQSEVIVHVSPDFYDFVLLAKSEYQALLSGNAHLEIHSDETLHLGDVLIETPNGNVDASLATQLRQIEKAVRDVMI